MPKRLLVLLAVLCVAGLGLSPAALAETREGNVKCSSDQKSFTINNNPGNGTFSDGTVSITISNSDDDSFNWTSNLSLDEVLVKGGDFTEVNPGGTSGFATSAFNQNSGKNYGISHVTFCYTIRASSPTPTPTPTPSPTPTTTPPPPPPPCDADATTPGIQPCDTDTELCPPGTDFAGQPMDDLKDCNRDDVGGEVITRPVEVCPSGPFEGMPMTNPRDCVGPDDRVLPNVIRRDARPEVAAETTEAGGGVLPFTGAGASSVLTLVGAAAALIGGGTFALRTRRKK